MVSFEFRPDQTLFPKQATFGLINAMPLRLQHKRFNLFLCAKRGFSLPCEAREPRALVALMRQLWGEMFDER